MDINTNCTHCGQPVTVDSLYIGQPVTCPKCGNPFLVRLASAVPIPATISAPVSAMTPPRQNGMAMASMILGILSLFCLGPIGGILAIVFGIIARNQIKSAPAQFTGGSLATAGIILGSLGILLSVGLFVFFIFFHTAVTAITH